MNNETKDAQWKKEESKMIKLVVFSISTLVFLIVLLVGFLVFTGCTLSFQNISTHGTATDLVDEEQTASPKTDATIPISLNHTP